MDHPAVRTKDLGVSLGGRVILEGISLELTAGETVWVVGPNGSGKTTLLRAIAGLVIYSGEVHISGTEPYLVEGKRSFTYAPDHAVLYDDLTLSEHAHYTARLYGQPSAEKRILVLLESFRLEDRIEEFPVTHSRGMQQKLSLALALGIETPFIMVDEPFDGLDRFAVPVLTEALAARAASGGAVLLSAHQTTPVDALAEKTPVRTVELLDGRIDPGADAGG